ncbi:MAG: hypothetical protein GX455_11645 [Phycisphaerae bacterium]|nr:hypothetical protein [Phycisphaerae bacterium]
MRLVLFEDAETKLREIYIAAEKMDPYPEAVHILMGAYGSPPARLNEGFAVYMVERMGLKAMHGYGGGDKTIREYARELKSRGDWIVPKELMAFTEIGSEKTRPKIAYPQAASLVQYVIDTYGKELFFKAYGTLKNSRDMAVQENNLKKLETLCGKSLDDFLQEWENFLSDDAGS